MKKTTFLLTSCEKRGRELRASVTECTKYQNLFIVMDYPFQVEKHKDNLGAIMITYPSTNGFFDEGIK
jgi:hypothetical protein